MSTDTEVRTGTYEVMILAGQSAAAQLTSLLEHIHEIFGRASAEVIAMKKWDDRRLAFEIEKQKRGVYFLAYINCPTDMIPRLERDVQISEQVMRILVTKADHLTDEEIAAADERQALADEAKMRLDDSSAEAAEGAAKVRLGAPTKAEIAESPAEAAAEPAAEPASEDAGSDAAGEESGEGEKTEEASS